MTSPHQDHVLADIPDDSSPSLYDGVIPIEGTDPLPLPDNNPLFPSTSPSPEKNPPRRLERIRRFPKHLHDFAAHIELDSPDSLPELQPEITFQQVHNNPLWQAAMKEEIDSIRSNNTWTLVNPPPPAQESRLF